MTSFLEHIQIRAIEAPDKAAYIYLDEQGEEEKRLTNAEVFSRSLEIAAFLRSVYNQGSIALLAFPPGPEFITAFYGCLFAGIIAVPTPMPGKSSRDDRLQSIVAASKPDLILTDIEGYNKFREAFQELSRPIHLSENIQHDIDSFRIEFYDESDLAYLQFTSGSTSNPKGVMITHGNILDNARIIDKVVGDERYEDSSVVTWLPHYHDMGLVSGFLTALLINMPLVSMAPTTFVKNPSLWLKAISKYRGILSGGPDFGYRLCLSKFSEEIYQNLDLSSWKVAFNGAEPIRVTTFADFERRFSAYGFVKSSYFPCYGLAEATLIVTGGTIYENAIREFDRNVLDTGRAIPNAGGDVRRIASCGRVRPSVDVVIVNAENCEKCPDGHIGEIWVSGKSVGAGYWQLADETNKTFRAVLANGKPDKTYMRTGDLGFLLGEELFITGRLKDLMIINGRNIHPEDVEAAVARTHPSLENGAGTAFMFGPEDAICIVHEASGQRSALPEAAKSIRNVISQDFGLSAARIVLVRAKTLPRTSSGKIQRKIIETQLDADALHILYEEGAHKCKEYVDLGTERLSSTAHAIAQMLGSLLKISVEEIDRTRALLSFGVDSIVAIQLLGEIEKKFSITYPMSMLAEGASINEVANFIDSVEDKTLPEVILDSTISTESFPLTPLQQAYWIGHQGIGGKPAAAYAYFELDGINWDIGRLERAFGELVQRHEMLRATFPSSDHHEIIPWIEGPFIKVEDLSLMEQPDLMRTLDQKRSILSGKLLNVEAGPLWDIHLSVMPRRAMRLHIGIDLLIADIMSLSILFREWGSLYGGDNVESLPPVSGKFSDHCNKTKLKLVSQEDKDYWKAVLTEISAPPDLPRLSELHSQQADTTVRHQQRVSSAQWDAFRARCSAHNLTPASALLSTFCSVLEAWSRNQDFALTITAFDRDDMGESNVVGDFTTTMPFVWKGREEKNYIRRLQKSQKKLWESMDHSGYSGVDIQRDMLRGDQTLMGNITQVVFTCALGEAGSGMSALRRLGTPVYGISRTPSVLLDNQIYEDDGELVINWDVACGVYAPGVIEDIFGTFGNIIRQMADIPTWDGYKPELVPVKHLQIQAQANATSERLREPGDTIVSLVRSSIFNNPDAVAIENGNISLTYQALGTIVSHLVSKLIAAEVQPGMLVPIIAEKGWEQIAASLAIMALGGAFVPIDANLPDFRITEILDQIAATVIVTDRARAIPASENVKIFNVSSADIIDQQEWVIDDAKEDMLAYVIFTSGSTGRPKGVMIDHGPASNTLLDINRRFNVSDKDRILALSSFSFDLSIYDSFGILAAGGTIVVPEKEKLLDPKHWLDLVLRHNISVWNTVPALMEIFVSHLESLRNIPEMPDFRIIMMSGDWIPVSLPQRIRSALRHKVDIISLGGATEASIWSITHIINENETPQKSFPYGLPMANQTFHVFDEGLEPRPIWVCGELFIGGVGLARGYWGDKVQTDKAFFIHPQTGERLYRTGDYGRYLPNGEIEFMGRIDNRIKIAGFRIELSEIEANFLNRSLATSVIVEMVNGPAGSPVIVAYYVPHITSINMQEDDILKELRKVLPPYMLPRRIIRLDRIPLNSNGKIDRKGLPSPFISKSETGLATTPTEQELVNVLKENFSMVMPDIERSFFELGLSSIDLTRLHMATHDKFPTPLSLVNFFEYTSVGALAKFIDARGAELLVNDIGYSMSDRVVARKNYMRDRRQKRQGDG